MPSHDSHHHRRHARAALPFALPDPEAIPNAIASAIPDAFPNPFALPDPEPKAEASPAPAQTMVSVVYVTAAPTFDGPIGGYSTVGADETTIEQAQKSTSKATPTKDTDKAKPTVKSIVADTSSAEKTASKNTHHSSSTGTDLPTAITSPKTTLSSSLALLAATGGISSTISSSQTSATVASSSSTASADSSNGGMSAGGKAGLAIGILLLIGAILSIILFCFKKRKDAAKRERLAEEQMNEKDAFAGAGRAASTRTTATAPRLSLRPVTQFLPNLGEKRQSRGNALLAASTAPVARQATPNQDQNRDNPFGNHAEAIDATNANGPAPIQVTSPNGEVIVAAGTGAAAGAVAAGGLTRSASKLGNGPKPMDFTTKNPTFMGPPSPSGTEFSQSSETAHSPPSSGTGAAIAAAGGPANTAVHRVQLDFKPSMEDELELRAGQLIRMLHEYDDGWALCIRLDRSQQGVVPRTCLSTRPVKPRPQQNGPRGPPPGMRGPIPPGQARPMSPGMNSPRGPPGQGRPMSPAGRPMNPNGPQYNPQGPMTPQGQGRPRSPSAAQTQARRITPPGPSPMNFVAQADGAGSPPGPQNFPSRKPVPGQAL